MTYEKKNGEFACFKKQSKKGTPYFNGTLLLDGKEYWISIFNSHSQKGEQYLSGRVEPKQTKPEEPQEVDAGWTTPPDGFDPVKNEFTDKIDF
jgi:hypothetical protein